MKIIYLAYGGENYYIQTFCSIVSFCWHNPDRLGDCVLYTDSPDFFATLPVEIRQHTFLPDTQWGLHMLGFARLQLLQQALAEFQTGVLCVDSDTLWMWKLPVQEIQPDVAYFHMFEANLVNYNNQLFAPVYDHADIRFGEITNTKVYNASSLWFAPKHLPLLREVYALSCEIYQKTQQRTADQVAFSYIFGATTNIHCTYEYIFHYRAYKWATLHKIYQLMWGSHDYDLALRHMPKLLQHLSLGSMQFIGKTGDVLKDYYIEKPEKLKDLMWLN